MWFNNFKLISKKNLTKDVFLMTYESENDFSIIPGQFITFMLPKTWFARAYSVLFKEGKKCYFIIKRLENWRWWSIEICDYDDWVILKWVWPVGHFIDSKMENNKLFIWTGTGMVPLYYIVRDLLESGFKQNLKLILWNREEKDLYYIKEFIEFKEKYSNFDFDIFLSQEENNIYNNWRVTDFLTKENIKNFREFYICWNPYMVNDSINILRDFWVEDDKIFREKY